MCQDHSIEQSCFKATIAQAALCSPQCAHKPLPLQPGSYLVFSVRKSSGLLEHRQMLCFSRNEGLCCRLLSGEESLHSCRRGMEDVPSLTFTQGQLSVICANVMSRLSFPWRRLKAKQARCQRGLCLASSCLAAPLRNCCRSSELVTAPYVQTELESVT